MNFRLQTMTKDTNEIYSDSFKTLQNDKFVSVTKTTSKNELYIYL